MSASDHTTASDPLARHWARKGLDELDMIEATLNLARQLLASGAVEPYARGENPFHREPYPWENTETPLDAKRRIYLGTVSDLVTGQGHTVWFAAGLAKDENEFRRMLAAHIGHALANVAEVSTGLGDFPFSRTFISDPLHQILKKFDDGKDTPVTFLLLSRWSENGLARLVDGH